MRGQLETQGGITSDSANSMAQQWMKVTDTEEKGTLNFENLSELFKKLSENVMDGVLKEGGIPQEKLKSIFNELDKEGAGEVNSETFGKVILMSYLSAKHKL